MIKSRHTNTIVLDEMVSSLETLIMLSKNKNVQCIKIITNQTNM